MRRKWRVVTVTVMALLAAGCANETSAVGPAGLKLRTIEMTMTEMAFSPSQLTVKVGETVTFRISNAGTVRHEAVFGDQAAQDSAMAMMAQMDSPGTGMTTTTAVAPQTPGRAVSAHRSLGRAGSATHPGMGLPNVLSLDAGETGEISFQFALATTFLIQCHEKGHLEMGMTATLLIEPA